VEGGLAELVRRHTDLGAGELTRLHALVADWQLLADLSFADLLLHVPARDPDAFVIVAQVRPATGPTSHVDDLVGTTVTRASRPLLATAYDEDRICRDADPFWRGDVPIREETIPVPGANGRPFAVVTRHTNLVAPRAPSRLELTYLGAADELAQMVHEGTFPFPGALATDANVRAGDGLIRLDAHGRVSYASPNALSAYRRLGVTSDLVGETLATVTALLGRGRGSADDAVAAVLSGRAPREGEIEAHGAVVRLRAIPLTPGGRHIGALVLVRDMTDLRRRDRELLTKDATIREIHHRVKNNLQTVAALLRLQARRLESPEAQAALAEAVRRVGSIAVVHETLSLTLDEAVAFDDIADRLIAMVGDVASDAPRGGTRVIPRRSGSFGLLPAAVATPLAMVLTELVHNAVEHGTGEHGGVVEVRAELREGSLRVTVADEGPGLPGGFDVDRSGSLGLHIVATLVRGELEGALEVRNRAGTGAEAVVEIPLSARS
jgi:two-component system, sensor histidine kinase PdtaS